MSELLFKDPRDYLRFEFEMRKARRPAYSLRAFARDLEMSPSGLNDFLKARVGMSAERVEKIADRLNWSDNRREHFLDLVFAKFNRDPGTRESCLMRVRSRLKDGSYGLSIDAFKSISEWYHMAILELCSLRPEWSSAEIAKQLSLPPLTVAQALKRLIKLGLLKAEGSGYIPVDANTHYGDEIPSDAIRSFHSQMLDLAQKALQEKNMKERVSHSLIYSVSQKDVPKMNDEIRKAVLNIINRYAQTKNADSIQALTLQAFPIWEGNSK